MSRHDGVQGNERADSEARAAASEGLSLEDELPGTLQEHTLPYSLTALSGAFREALWDRWKSTWPKSPRKGWMDKIDDKLPSHSFLTETSHMSRAQASILMQLCRVLHGYTEGRLLTHHTPTRTHRNPCAVTTITTRKHRGILPNPQCH